MEKYKNWIENAFKNANNDVSKLPKSILEMDGMSGNKTRHFYNNMISMEDCRYLEIGTWKGSSVCSAMYGNNSKVVCIDNWSQFQGPKNEFLSNFEKYKGDNDAHFIECDCFSVNVSQLPKFNVYLYDGEHSVESHYRALVHYYDCLDPVFIFIVDDWNWESVRSGTYLAIQKLNLKILYEKEVRLTHDDSHTPEHIARENWWNGIYITILQKRI